MKKHLLLNQLFGTVGSPNQTDETLTRENRIGLMSYLRRTLMLLLVAYIGIGNVWGTDLEIPLTNLKYFPLDYGLVTITNTENVSISSNQLQVSSTTGKFKVATSVSGFYLKSISFTDANSSKNGGFSCDENASYMTGPSDKVYTYTAPTTTTTEANFTLIGTGGTAKMGTIIITVSTSEQVERLSSFGSISSYKIPFTSSATTTSIELSVPTSNGVSVSSSKIQISTSAKHLIVSTKNHEKIKYIAIPKYQQATYAISGTSTPSGTYADNGWTPSSSDVESVDLSLTASGSTTYSQEIFVVYTSGGGCTPITPTWSTGYSSTTLNVGATSSTPVVGKDGSSGAVTFSSSDTYIATVNSSGVVTGVGAGTATITATVAANGDYCSGTVTEEFTIKAGITYNANGADGGSVPTDASTYAYNANITVAGNTGSLYKTGFVFNGWNTRSDGTGTHYEAGATMKMPSKSTGVILYAEWVGYATSWEWWNCGQSNNSTTFTYITSKNYICSFASSASTAVASWDLEGGEYYRGIKIKTKDHSIAFWVQTGKRVSITFGTRPTKPTFTVGGVDKSSDVGASENADSITVTYTTTGDTKFYIENETATNKAFTVKSVKIEDDAPSCTAPNHVDITGDWHIWNEGSMTLTAKAYASAGTSEEITEDLTYQWYFNGTAEGNKIAGATSATYSKDNCTYSDAGAYYCKISTGEGCSTTSGFFNVKMLQVFVKDGSSDYGTIDLTDIGSYEAQGTIRFASGSHTYKFGIRDGSLNWYGNNGTMTSSNCTNWSMDQNADCQITTTGYGTYTFTVKFGNMYDESEYGKYIKVSVNYPSDDQASGKVIYFDNTDRNWSNIYYRIGKTDHNQNTKMTAVPGTASLYKATTSTYNDLVAWHISNNVAWSGSNTIYRTYTDNDQYQISEAIEFDGAAVTDAAITILPRSGHYKGGSSENSNCDFYYYNYKKFLVTHTATIGSTTNGSVRLNWTDINNAAQSATSTTSGLAHTCNLQITGVPATGYDVATLTVNGSDFTSGNTHILSANATIAATFSLHDYNVTYSAPGNGNSYTIQVADGSASSASKTATMGQTVTIVASPTTGYDFTGWTINKAGGGTVTPADASATTTTFTMPANDVTIVASFALKTYTVTMAVSPAGYGSVSSESITSVPYGSSISTSTNTVTINGTTVTATPTTATSAWTYAFDNWSNATGTITAARTITANFTRTGKSYTITLDKQVASNTPTGSVSATYGSAMPSIATLPSHANYTFGGFYTAVAGGGTCYYNGSGTSQRSSDFTSASTLYAKFTQSITVDDNGGSSDGTVTVLYNATSATVTTAPVYADHTIYKYMSPAGDVYVLNSDGTFAGTNVTDGESYNYITSSKWTATGATALKAYWKCNTPEISCTSNVITITVPSGSTVYYTTNGATPTSSSLEYDPSDKPTISANTTIKAIAIQDGCVSSDVASEDCTYEGGCTPTTLFSMVVSGSASDYSLAGNTTVTSADAVVSGRLTSISGGTLSIVNTSKSSSKTIFDNNCLYASSQDVQYIVALSGSKTIQAGDVITVTTRTAYYPYITNSTSRTSEPTLAKSGSSDPFTYTLTVANTNAASGKNLIGYGTLYFWKGSSTTEIHSITITRPCVASTHTISYDKGEGTGTMSSETSIPHNGSKTLTSNTFTAPSNYTFAGWVADVDVTIGGSSKTAGTLIADGATITNIISDIALTAKWKQTITLNANTANHGSGDNTSAIVWKNATALYSITHTTAASGYKLAGYYTAATDGTKVLNADGTFAGTAITDYISDGKWTRTSTTTLFAQYESAGALIWNLGVNTDATSLTTSSKSSAYTEIAVANMADATVNGVTYSKSKKSNLTGKISTPATYDASKYVYVTFQVAAGYKFIPSSIKVPVQPVGDGEDKDVKLSLTDESSHSLVSASATTCDGTSSGKTTTVSLAGDGSKFFTGTVTLKIYVYNHSGSSTTNNCYRLGTPIQIDGSVEEACTMPSYTSMSYTTTTFAPGADASGSPISIVGGSDITTYQWKYNTVNDRTSGTNCGTNSASLTPLTNEGAATDGTRYYWCEMTNACGTIKSPAVAITVAAAKSNATVTWSNPGTVNYGGGGYTIRATVDQSAWDGSASGLSITAPAGIRIYNVTSGTDGSSKKYVEVNFDVQTSFDRTTYASNIPFAVSADATASYNAISADKNVSYSACTGGSAAEVYMPVDVSHIDNDTWKGGWVYDGIGMMRYSHGGSAIDDGNVKSLAHNMGESDEITKYYKSSANHFGFYTESAINGVRLYVYTSNDKSTVSGVYIGDAAYTTGTPSTGAVTYEATYYNDDDGMLGATNDGCTWAEIIFDSEVAAGKYGQINVSKNVNIAGMAFLSTSGGGATLTTYLQWSGGLADKATVAKKTTDAYFTYSASKITANTNTLGAITYSSSNTSVATVDATGKVALIAAGSTTIKATLAASGCYKSAEISYTLNVTEDECSIAAGTLALTSGSETKCSSDEVTLTLTGFESGATIQWKDGDTDINNGGNYAIATDGTTSTLTTDQPGTYSVIVTKSCFVRSNRITITNKSAEASVSKIVDEWYIKQGRLTPDIALFNAEGATSFTIKNTSDVEVTSIAGCTFELKDDGIIYLHGYSTAGVGPTGIESAANETIKVVVADACGNTANVGNIIIHKQVQTDKHVLAFVVTGTEKGDFTAGITAAQTTSVDLYNTIAANFDVQATNIYSTDNEQKLKEYYSQFDILCITDYPNTGKTGVNSKSYVDALGSLIDIRPILTMEAYVSKLANWKAKGISGTPKSPTTRQYTMLLQCKDHEIFAGTELTKVGEGDETMYRVSMVDNTLEDYATLDATYGAGAHAEKSGYEYGTKPALQGFTFDATMVADGLLPLGQIDDGAGNDLEVGIERQTEMEARLMVLGINSYAMERLTDDGQTVVINALKYLMKKNSEDIADCSNTFVGGADGDATNWANAENWSGNTVPDKTQKVRIVAPCVIMNGTKAHVAGVIIAPNGKYNHGSDDALGHLTISAGGALIVDGQVEAATSPFFTKTRATSAGDLTIGANEDAQGALIFDNEDGETNATVAMYSASYWEVVAGKKKKYWSYVALPIQSGTVGEYFYNGFSYLYDETAGWIKKGMYTELHAFEGLGISMQSGNMEYFHGALAPTTTQEITLTHGNTGENLIGNSWTAPIQIANFDASDFGDATATVSIYSTGRDDVLHNPTYVTATVENDGAVSAGQWVSIPIGLPGTTGYDGLSVIPAMQAFQVNTTTETTLTLDYDKLVRDVTMATDNLTEKQHSPVRRTVKKDLDALMRVRMSGTTTRTDVWLLEDSRFSDEFDNGWEATYVECDNRSPQFYANSEIGKMAFLAKSDIEGTILGLAPSRDGNEYLFTFHYVGDDEFYLNDLKLQKSVLISEENNYPFFFEDGDTNRFYISRTRIDAPAITTGCETVETKASVVRKVIVNDHVYIIRNGHVYSAQGALVK